MTSYLFSKMAATKSEFYFQFRWSWHPYLGRSKSTCRPNFGEISKFTAEILLLPMSENKCPPCWNSASGFDFQVSIIIDMLFCICLLNFVQIGPTATIYENVISIFQGGVHGVTILLPVSLFVTSLKLEGRNLPADQISARYINPQLRYRFLKTNDCHVGILLPVSIFTFASTATWVMSYEFCKNYENRLRFDKVTESLKVETFWRHSA